MRFRLVVSWVNNNKTPKQNQNQLCLHFSGLFGISLKIYDERVITNMEKIVEEVD